MPDDEPSLPPWLTVLLAVAIAAILAWGAWVGATNAKKPAPLGTGSPSAVQSK